MSQLTQAITQISVTGIEFFEKIFETPLPASIKSKLDHFADALYLNNKKRLSDFLKKHQIPPGSHQQVTENLWSQLYSIEKKLRLIWNIHNPSHPQDLKRLHEKLLSQIPKKNGFYLKADVAKDILNQIPFDKPIKEPPLFQLATGRYSQNQKWNQAYIDILSSLKPDDFEVRAPSAFIVDHNKHKQLAQNILAKKCFNTHDKITGTHIITSVSDPMTDKNWLLRTATKWFHYQFELEFFGELFEDYSKNNSFGSKLHKTIKHHSYKQPLPLFNSLNLVEGLANLAVPKGLKLWVSDLPDLEPWIQEHQTVTFLDNKILSLSLWRLTAWQLKGNIEHSCQMYSVELLCHILMLFLTNDKTLRSLIKEHSAQPHQDLLQYIN